MKISTIGILGLAVASASLVGCQGLDLSPEQSLSVDDAFSSLATAQASVNGVYSLAQQIEVFGALPQIINDYQADNVNFVGSFPTLQEIAQYTTLTNNTTIRDIWRRHYQVINAANAVIDNVPGINNDVALTDDLKAQFVGEAKFIRAITYLQLVNLFGQPYTLDNGASAGVPLVLSSFTGASIDRPARATVAEVYAQIEADLQDALTSVPAMYGDALLDRGKATVGAVNGYLARVALYKGDYAGAETYANAVIADPMYALATGVGFYNSASSEDVFTIIMTANDNSRTGAGGWASYYNPAALGGRGDCPFSTDLVNSYEAGDLRLALSDSGSAADGLGALFTKKFPDASTNSDNAPLMRIAEMHLTLAEAIAEQRGLDQTAVDQLNLVRERAGLAPKTLADFPTSADLISEIMKERRLELAFEGHRRMDLLRKGMPLRTAGAGAGTSNPGDTYVVLPIPQREMDINTNLVQNPGY